MDGYGPDELLAELSYLFDLPEEDGDLDALFGLGQEGDPEVGRNREDNDFDEG